MRLAEELVISRQRGKLLNELQIKIKQCQLLFLEMSSIRSGPFPPSGTVPRGRLNPPEDLPL
jgi:hypothetical protein